MNAHELNEEHGYIQKLLSDLMLGRVSSDSLTFDEKYLHEICGSPLNETEHWHQVIARQQTIKAIGNGDLETANEFAEHYYDDPAILGGTTLRPWLAGIMADFEIDKRQMTVTFRRPK